MSNEHIRIPLSGGFLELFGPPNVLEDFMRRLRMGELSIKYYKEMEKYE